MKIMLGLGRNHYVAKVGIFLIMVALIAGTVGCATVLTLTVTPTPGGHTKPREGIRHSYSRNEEVTLKATENPDWKFLKWTGDGVDALLPGYLDTDSLIKIKMDKSHSITASFEQVCFTDIIGPERWCLFETGTGVDATVTGSEVIVDINSFPTEDPSALLFGGGAAYYTSLLTGDFDISMDYTLDKWPATSGVRVGLCVRLDGSSDQVGATRVGRGSTEGSPWEVYLVDNFYSNMHHFEGITPTSDLQEKIRIKREGSTLTCFYYDTGSGSWQEFDSISWYTGAAVLNVAAWSHEWCFGDQPVSVSMHVDFI
jgi:hypothetical protein